MSLKFIKPERISLANHPEYREKWVQERIAEDPSILGLGDIVLKDKERSLPHGGRLDLLFQDAESSTRYEVEIMLGSTDESHIIRTIEYWDLEKKRYPQYDHYGVIVAEDITSRFLNVIGLFNGFIPLIALQMSALKFDDQISLVFTKVMDAMSNVGGRSCITDESLKLSLTTGQISGRCGLWVELLHSFFDLFKIRCLQGTDGRRERCFVCYLRRREGFKGRYDLVFDLFLRIGGSLLLFLSRLREDALEGANDCPRVVIVRDIDQSLAGRVVFQTQHFGPSQ